MQLTWLGQSGFLVEEGETRCAMDLFLTRGPDRLVEPPLEPEGLPALGTAFVSHEHPDHFDAQALARLLRAQPGVRVVMPEPIVPVAVDAGLPSGRLVGSRPGRWSDAAGLRFQPVPALHGITMDDAYGFGPGGQTAPRFLGYVVEIGGRRVYHAGDSLAWSGLADVLRALNVDIACLPVNGRDPAREAAGTVGNMDHGEAIELAAAAGCRTVVTMHHGMFEANTVDPDLAVAYASRRQPGLAVIVPELGRRRSV